MVVGLDTGSRLLQAREDGPLLPFAQNRELSDFQEEILFRRRSGFHP